MEGLAMLEQTRWSEAPEMSEAPSPSRGDVPGQRAQARVLMRGVSLETERASERELDVGSSQEDHLLPRRRRASVLAALPGRPSAATLAACAAVLGAAGLLATRRPGSQAMRGGVSLVLGNVASQQDGGRNATLKQKAEQGQAFVYLSTEDAGMMVVDHMLILDPDTHLEDLHRIEQVYVQTGVLRLYHGLQYTHQEGATVVSVPPSGEVLEEHDALNTSEFERHTKRVHAAEEKGGTGITMREGCHDFDQGDEVELSSEEGHYEFNLITSITTNDGETCEFHLAYPLEYEHSSTSNISKMVRKEFQPLQTPAPPTAAPPTPAPTLAPTASAAPTPAPAPAPTTSTTLETPAPTAAPPTPAPTPAPTASAAPAPEHEVLAARFAVNVDFAGLNSSVSQLEEKCAASVARALGIDASHVSVKLNVSGVDGEVRARRLQEGGSVLVDVLVDPDASSKVEQAGCQSLQDAILSAFKSDAGATGNINTSAVASEDDVLSCEGGERKPNVHGPATAVVVSAIVIGFAVIGIVLFMLGNVKKEDEDKPDNAYSRWWQNPPSAIVVPGGGLSRDGSLVPWVQERLRRAKEVYDEVNEVKAQQQVTSTTYLVTMCEGIRYSPRDPRGNRAQRLESQLSFEFLRKEGVKASDIITDDLSLDTMGNAYFLRTTHTDVFKARSLVVITNEFHMKRTKAIFQKVFGLGPFPEGNSKYSLEFEQVKNQSIEQAALRRRVDWEDQQLRDFERVSRDWKDLHDVHSFIFSGEGSSAKPQLRDRSPETDTSGGGQRGNSRETSPQRPSEARELRR